jgi:asparagine synthase (glutamine-hydrolysing)
MSGIVALYHRTGPPPQRRDVQRMLDAMPHRAPDGSSVWASGPVALGHAAHHTTPEAESERWPLTNRAETTALVADARIDNRAELIRTLRPPRTADGLITDAGLILSAYQRWGRDCPVHLIGDYAFVLWDATEHRLFGARDATGVRPFFYRDAPGEPFAVASEIKALRRVSTGRWTIRDEQVGDYLAALQPPPETTFYTSVYRLPPGHAIDVRPGRVRTWAYWELDPEREIRHASDEQAAEAFAERFDEAVRCRLRSNRPVGAYLSGGLDSSSIVVTARDLRHRDAPGAGTGPLQTVSTVYDRFPSCDERAYMQAVLEQGGFDPLFIRADDVTPLDGLEDLVVLHDEPFLAPNLPVKWHEHRLVAESGPTVLLDGHGGDEVVSQGAARLHELARAGNWLTLAGEVRGLSQVYGETGAAQRWASLVWREAVQPWTRKRGWTRLVARLLRKVGGRLRSPSPAVRRAVGSLDIIAPDFRRRIQLEERRRTYLEQQRHVERTARAQHHRHLALPMQGQALEILDRTARARGLEVRFPFFDRRLVEFCLALPADQKLRNGYGRYILRTAMHGRLPDPVRTRLSKVDFTPHLASGLYREWRRGAPLLRASRVDKEYIRPTGLADIGRIVHEKTDDLPARTLYALLQAVILSEWMRTQATADACTERML